MPPTRKSLPGKRQSMKTAESSNSSVAGSSAASLASAQIPASLTPGYVRSGSAGKRRQMTEAERDRLVLEMIGMDPRALLNDITEAAHFQIYSTVEAIQGWVARVGGGRHDDASEREVDTGLPALESLLESHVDIAFDKLTSWGLRNAFGVPDDLDIVFPWHRGLDFDRGEYVVKQGIDLAGQIESLRSRVEQARRVKRKLVLADQALDRRLAVARQRRAEIAFVKEIAESAGLSPLPQTAAGIARTMQNLHTKLSAVSPVTPSSGSSIPAGSNAKAWELGRQAYLDWATNKVVHATKVETGADELEDAQAALGQDVEALAAGLAKGA